MTDQILTPPEVTLKGAEVRTFTAYEIREVQGTDSNRFIEGIAVPYDEWSDIGWFMEQFAPGAFEKSCREAARHAPLLLFHDNERMPAGRAVEWHEEAKGLRGVWEIDTKDDHAVEAARKAKDGFLTGLSVGFSSIQQETAMDDNGVLWITRTEARLHEVSLTPTPAYAGSQVSLVRSRVQHVGKPDDRRSAQLDGWRDYLKEIKR